MNTKEIVNTLIKNGADEVKGAKIKNATVTLMEDWVRLGLTLDKEVAGYKSDDEGNYEPSKVNVIFVSAFTVASLLKESDEAAFAANHLVKHPDAMAMILSRATIDIVQERVEAGTEYKNPFAGEDSKSVVFDHETIINHVTKITLSEFGINRLNRLADLMLGF